MIEPYDEFDFNDPRNRFDPNTDIMLIWRITDVQEVRPDLDDEKAFEVLKQVERNHDANEGVNWEILKFWANDLFPKEDTDERD